ncbi:MAG: 30S ribosomal protein S6 [Planctomycetota bacterium]|nr:30S ribosomal protein S6 [Planctomycetota bacterium]
MSQIYESMILLSNQVVREDWRKAKALVGGFLTKHGASIKSLRRYEERRLSYPMAGNLRATYYLAYFEIPGDSIPQLRREFELSEVVLRNLILAVDEMPEEELALAALEDDAEYTVPAPPADDAPTEEELAAEAAEREAEAEAEAARAAKEESSESTDGEGDSDAATEETKTEAEAPKEA